MVHAVIRQWLGLRVACNLAIPLLILFTDGLDIRFAVGIEEFFAALLPGGFEFGGGDVPVWAAFLGDGAEVLAKFFDGGTAEEPVAVVNLVNDETGLEDDHVGDHGIVDGVGVLGDIAASERKGQWAPTPL